MNERRFWQADSYEQFGYLRSGKVHEIDDENPLLLFCGKGINADSGRVVIPGKPVSNVEPTCKGCINGRHSRAQYRARELEWEKRRIELAAEREQESLKWWAAYDAYRQTPEWQRIRAAVLRRNPICQGCGINRSTQAHHLTYETYNRLGITMLFELVAVCEDCHRLIHQQQSE
jgi:5-methylcytosine-specific restriction endonuclease McrA